MQFEYEPYHNGDNETEQPAKAGRPIGSTKLQPDEDTIKQISGLARIQCSQREAAAVLGVHVDTFRDFLNRHEKAMEAWEDGRETGKASLRRHQYKSAENGNPTMQIWLGKQWLDQTDKSENTLQGPAGGPVQLSVLLGKLTSSVLPGDEPDDSSS